jgi:hypothetical protein
MGAILLGFAVFSVISVAAEAVFTGIGDQVRNVRNGDRVNWNLPCRSYLWSILVYGASAMVSFPIMGTLFPAFFALEWWWRGLFYVVGIFFWEFVWGWLIELVTGTCPWQYRRSTWRVWRYIKPEYAGFWFGFGFILEWAHAVLIPVLAAAFIAA